MANEQEQELKRQNHPGWVQEREDERDPMTIAKGERTMKQKNCENCNYSKDDCPAERMVIGGLLTDMKCPHWCQSHEHMQGLLKDAMFFGIKCSECGKTLVCHTQDIKFTEELEEQGWTVNDDYEVLCPRCVQDAIALGPN